MEGLEGGEEYIEDLVCVLPVLRPRHGEQVHREVLDAGQLYHKLGHLRGQHRSYTVKDYKNNF